jgi:Na+/H+ antiporter NhaD/arsenite permease-like protein
MIEFFMMTVFVTGYLAMTLEHRIHINKAAVAILTGVFLWALYSMREFYRCGIHEYINVVVEKLNGHLHDIAQILIFLLGAMTIVALIETYGGFKVITDFIKTKDKRKLLWVVSLITFFLSSILDNLTTAIVMVSLLRRLVPEREDRLIFASLIIIAANAGGAWTPIGDVTTTMLWIGGQVTTAKIMKFLFLPSLISLIVPLIYFSFLVKKGETVPASHQEDVLLEPGAKRVFFLGIGSLIFVPIFRALTNLPPFMGVLLGLGIMWVITDLINHQKDHLKVPHVLTKVDFSSILFFLGILLAVAALESVGILGKLAAGMDTHLKNKDLIVTLMGLVSSIIDNVPLTAAAIGMYPLSANPVDSKLWEMLAFSVGTGGSLLIIGSAAGVVVMGMEKVNFFWYLRKITWPAFIGYLMGIFIYLIIYAP